MFKLVAGSGFVAFVLAWLQPLHILPWVGWHSEVLTFFAVFLLFGGSLIFAKTSGTSMFVPRAVPFVGLLIPIAIIQHIFGLVQFSGDAIVISLYESTAILAILVGYNLTRTEQFNLPTTRRLSVLEWLSVCTLVAAVASVILALTQSFEVWTSAGWINRTGSFRRPGANFGQPNHLATLLLLGAASLLFMCQIRRISVQFCIVLLAYLAVGLAVTESRTGIVGAALLTVWWLAYPNTKVTQLRVLACTVVWVDLLVFVIAWPRWIAEFYSPGIASSAAESINLAAGSRLYIWPQLIDAALQKPWFGWGLREVSQAHNAVLHKYVVSEPFTYAHNLVLDAFIGLGLPMTLLATGIVVTWAWTRIRSVKNAMGWYCVAFILPVAVHSLFEFPFAYAYFLFPVMVVVGVLESECGIRPAMRWPVWILVVGFAVTLVTAMWTVVEYVEAEEDFRVARFEAIHWGKTPLDYDRPHFVLLTQLQTMLDASRAVPKAGMPPETIAMLRSAALRFPWTAIQNRYALSLALNGQPDEAARQLKVMRAMHGQKAYAALKTAWQEMARTEHPQLLQFEMP